MAKEKEKKETVDEIADGLVKSLTETEGVLKTFRKIGSYYFRKKIQMSDVELTKQLDADTESFIRTQSEYWTMFYFLKRKNLLEKYAKFRGEVHAVIQCKMQEEEKPEVKADEPTA